MVTQIKNSLLRHYRNIPGWKTPRKIVVIESDDWGSIRMPSKKVYDKLLTSGIRVDKCPYNRYDNLESEDDLNALFETLTAFTTQQGNHPVITANTIVANPDFDAIRKSDFSAYAFEPFTDTHEKYKHFNAFNLWKEGISNGIFFPQLHGREHLNISRWLKALQMGFEETRFAFDHYVYGISTNVTTEKRPSYLAALDFDNELEANAMVETLEEAGDLFEKLFGFKAESFIAPNYVWDTIHEETLNKKGIRFIQGARVQQVPKGSHRKPIAHILGEENSLGQLYLVRNCFFEPSLSPSQAVRKCFSEIKTAFFWRKPAIISTHRLNFIGSIDAENRDTNLKLLRELLSLVITNFPEVEFLTSPELGRLISVDKKNG